MRSRAGKSRRAHLSMRGSMYPPCRTWKTAGTVKQRPARNPASIIGTTSQIFYVRGILVTAKLHITGKRALSIFINVFGTVGNERAGFAVETVDLVGSESLIKGSGSISALLLSFNFHVKPTGDFWPPAVPVILAGCFHRLLIFAGKQDHSLALSPGV